MRAQQASRLTGRELPIEQRLRLVAGATLPPPNCSYTEARQNLASLLDLAVRKGEVRVKRKDRQTFVIKPEQKAGSPLDVEGVDLRITTTEIVQRIRESRRVY